MENIVDKALIELQKSKNEYSIKVEELVAICNQFEIECKKLQKKNNELNLLFSQVREKLNQAKVDDAIDLINCGSIKL